MGAEAAEGIKQKIHHAEWQSQQDLYESTTRRLALGYHIISCISSFIFDNYNYPGFS